MPLDSHEPADERRRHGWKIWLAPFVIGWALATVVMFPGFFVVGLDGILSFVGYLFLYGTMLGIVGVAVMAILAGLHWLLDKVRGLTTGCI